YAAAALSLVSSLAFGATAGHGAEGGIPSSVMYQAINFILYAGLLTYFLRKPIKNYFAGREVTFKSALTKAQAARNEAEQRKREIQTRINDLESSSAASIEKARVESEALKTRIVAEAQALSKNLKEEAHKTAAFEILRAKNELREDLLNQSILLSKKILTEKIVEQDQRRLQTEFAEKIEVR
ncbi:MAG TPA: ATP synthase F0 subunit B, partial [Bdellovibrionales bacterium]|nr:ATP synthase F0 subunit B [Bdellovibrionales bacterium]